MKPDLNNPKGLFVLLCLAGPLLFFSTPLYAQPERKPMVLSELTYYFSGGAYYEGFSDVTASVTRSFISPRIVFAMNPEMADAMKQSLLDAMNDYWESDFSINKLEVKTSPTVFREFPKFKPKVQKGASPNWQVFVRVSDRPSFSWVPGAPSMAENETNLLFECKVLDGADGRETFSRSMQLAIKKLPPPPGSYMLQKVPGMPGAFLDAFDSAAHAFFSTGAPAKLELDIEPACLFVSDSLARQIRRLIRFTTEGNMVKVIDGPEMSWAPGKPGQEKTGKTRREGAGILGGILTATTGVTTTGEKSKTTDYLTTIPVTDPGENKTYTFLIPVTEKVVESVERNRERGTGTVNTETTSRNASRTINNPCHLTLEADTIGRFSIMPRQPEEYGDVFTRFWNGTDSSTVLPMPGKWSNEDLYNPLSVNGELYGKPFRFSNHKAGNQLDIYYDGMHVATLRVDNGRPVDGILYYADVPEKVLKALAMFSTLPYAWYGF